MQSTPQIGATKSLKVSWSAIFRFIAGLFLAATVWGQGIGGAIEGVVRDQSGGVMPAALIRITNMETAQARTVSSDSEGRYRARELPPGSYEVKVELAGFNTVTITGFRLSVGQIARQDIILESGANPTHGQNKQDLYNLATAAALAGRVEESVKFYCEVARLDASYKDSKLMCSIMEKERQKEEKKNEERFTVAVQDFDAARYDDAQQKFKNIRFGPRYEEAQQYLKVKIPQARQPAPNKQKEAEKKPQ